MQKQFEVAGPVELDVRLVAGEIEVDATLEGRVEIELIGHDEESAAVVEEARVELRDHASPKVVIDVPQRKSGFGFSFIFGRQGVTCRVRCPARSALTARTKSAGVTAHGVLELSCIVVAGAAGLRMGWALIDPGNRTRGEALRTEARAAVEIILGTAPWLVLAGLVEGFVTPAGTGLDAVVAVGLSLGAIYWGLVLWRGTPDADAARVRAAPAT